MFPVGATGPDRVFLCVLANWVIAKDISGSLESGMDHKFMALEATHLLCLGPAW